MNTTIDLGHVITLLGYVATTLMAAGAIRTRLDRVERDIDKLMQILTAQVRQEERILALEKWRDSIDEHKHSSSSHR